jgi:hypothetical protein
VEQSVHGAAGRSGLLNVRAKDAGAFFLTATEEIAAIVVMWLRVNFLIVIVHCRSPFNQLVQQ